MDIVRRATISNPRVMIVNRSILYTSDILVPTACTRLLARANSAPCLALQWAGIGPDRTGPGYGACFPLKIEVKVSNLGLL